MTSTGQTGRVTDPDRPAAAGDAPEQALDLAARRVLYTAGELLEQQLAGDPLAQFESWFREAIAARETRVPEPNAMVVATADAGGAPSTRTVLLKDVDG